MSTAMQDRTSIKTYVRKLTGHLINVYSAGSWLIALAGILPIWKGHSLPLLTALFAILSLLPAGYRAWLEAIRAQPAPAELTVGVRSVSINAPINQRVPAEDGHFDLRLDVSNPRPEPVDIASVAVDAWGVPEDLFVLGPPPEVHGQQVPGRWGRLTLPLRLEPYQRRLDLAVFVKVRVKTQPAHEFARRLFAHDGFSIRLRIGSENPARQPAVALVEAIGSLKDYRDMAVQIWESNKQTDLLVAAGNLKGS